MRSQLHVASSTTIIKVEPRVLAVGLAGFSAFLHLYATQSILPLLTQVFHTSTLAASVTVSATTIAVTLTAPIVGLVADRFRRKPVIVVAIFALVIPTLFAATATGLPALIGWRFVQGLFMPAIFAVTMAYISEEWKETEVGAGMAAYVTGNILGGVCGRFLSGVISTHLGWQWVFIGLGCLNLLSGAAVCRWLPPSRSLVRPTNLHRSLQSVSQHLQNPRLIAACGVGCCVLFSNVSTFTYVNFYLSAAPFELGPVALGSIFFVYLLGVLVTPLAGKWINQVGYRTALVIAMTTACGGVLLTLCQVLWVIIVGLAICSAGIFVCQATAKGYVGLAAGQARSTATGLYVACFYLGGSLGAILPGMAWSLGGWPACVGMIATLQLGTIVLALKSWHR
jgi:MFS transporter, YNFM family, putative membrane transport protein